MRLQELVEKGEDSEASVERLMKELTSNILSLRDDEEMRRQVDLPLRPAVGRRT